MNIIDCRNTSCPAPVVKTKKSLEETAGKPLRVLVDSGAPRENVVRFARGRGYDVTEDLMAEGYAITITPALALPATAAALAPQGPTVLLVATDRLGTGPDELGQLLMKNFLIALLEVNEPPETIFFINSGVLLSAGQGEVTEPLIKLAESGVEIMSCGVCLDYFGLREKLAIGSVTNMFTIAETMIKAGNVIRL